MQTLTREEIVEGLRAGRTLVMQRKDDPNLETLMQLQNEGLVTNELVQIDEQSSVLKWRWVN